MSGIVLAAAAIGLIVNTMAVLGVAWKGGHILGKVEASIDRLSGSVERLEATQQEHVRTLARVVAQLDDLERRVERIEGGRR